MIKAIIFDFDGVIHDTLDLSYKLHRKIGFGLTLDEYKDIFNGNVHKTSKASSEHIKEYRDKEEKIFEKLRVNPAIKKELAGLAKKYKLIILTSNRESTLSGFLKNNNMSKLFAGVFGLETEKSKIKKFRLIFEKFGINKDNSIFVTDTLGDILEANKTGIKTIAADFGFHEKERLEKGNPCKIISDFSQISLAVGELG